MNGFQYGQTFVVCYTFYINISFENAKFENEMAVQQLELSKRCCEIKEPFRLEYRTKVVLDMSNDWDYWVTDAINTSNWFA